jgi:hypothetical protein
MEITSLSGMSHIQHDLKTMTSRCDVAHVLNKYGLTREVAEIGADMGHFASAVLAAWKGKAYYAVDLWSKQDPRIYPETHFDHEASFRCALELAQKDRRLELIRLHSVTASALFEDSSLDWVWIDANHEYQPVMDDMNAWWPKVKPGGVFSGHDYPLPTVRPAVNRWMIAHKIPFVVSDSSWWSIKPKK